MIDFYLDCPIATTLFHEQLPVRGRLISRGHEALLMDRSHMKYYIYRSQYDAENNLNPLYAFSESDKVPDCPITNSKLSEPVDQAGSTVCYHYMASLSCTTFDKKRSYFLAIEFKYKDSIVRSNVGAFSFNRDSTLVCGPKYRLPSKIFDKFILVSYWVVEKKKCIKHIVPTFSFVNPSTQITQTITNDKQSSLNFVNMWPDATNAAHAYNTSLIEFNTVPSDFTALITVTDDENNAESVFFGNAQYDPKDFELQLLKVESDGASLSVDIVFWQRTVNLFEISISVGSEKALLYSSYYRRDNAFVTWKKIENYDFAFSANWADKNMLTLLIPKLEFKKPSDELSLRVSYGDTELQLPLKVVSKLNYMLADIIRSNPTENSSPIPMVTRSDLFEKRNESVLFCFHNVRQTEGAPRVLQSIIELTSFTQKHVLTFGGGELTNYLKSRVASFTINESCAISSLTDDSYSGAFESIMQHLMEVKPALVVLNSIDTFIVGDVAHRLGIPTVWIIHESVSPLDGYTTHGLKVRHRFVNTLRNVDNIIFVSEETQKLYSPFIKGSATNIIRNGIDVKFFESNLSPLSKAAERARLPILVDDHDTLLLTVGTTTRRKGQDRTVRALADMKVLYPDFKWKFVVVGGRKIPFYDELVSLIREFDLESQILIVDETAEVYSYYKAADIFICNSREESSPLVILEAMTARLPVVSTDVFGLKEILKHENNAIIFDPEQSHALLHALFRITTDNNLRDTIVNNAYAQVKENHDVGKMVLHYQSLFESLIA